MNREPTVMVAAAILFLWFLWGHDLWAPDEPFFAEGAREMLVDGHWLVTHVNGVVNNHKPPLFFWLIALCSLPFGAVSEFTARLPSVLAALATLWLTMRLGRRWYGPRTAALAGMLLMTATLFWDKARWSQTDASLCFLIWAALSAFEGYRAGDLPGRRAGVLFWSAAALAVLAKGPVGLLLPLLIALLVLVLDRDLARWRGFAPLLGPLTFAVIVGAWVLAATLWGPPGYSVLGSLREHFVDRGLHGMHHAQPVWYYLKQLPLSLMPWAGLLPAALLLAFRRYGAPGDRMALAASLFIVLFFTISVEKRDLYVLPAFPALMLLMANAVGRVCGWGEVRDGSATIDRRWVTIGQGVIGVCFLLLGLGAAVMGRRFEAVPYGALLVFAAIAFAAGMANLGFLFRKHPLRSVQSTIAGMSALYLFATAAIYPAIDAVKSGRAFALLIAEASADSRSLGQPVVAFRTDNLPNTFAFYTNGVYTIETRDSDFLADHLGRAETVFALVPAAEMRAIPPAALAQAWVVAKTRLSRKDLLLISNAPHSLGEPLAAGK